MFTCTTVAWPVACSTCHARGTSLALFNHNNASSSQTVFEYFSFFFLQHIETHCLPTTRQFDCCGLTVYLHSGRQTWTETASTVVHLISFSSNPNQPRSNNKLRLKLFHTVSIIIQQHSLRRVRDIFTRRSIVKLVRRLFRGFSHRFPTSTRRLRAQRCIFVSTVITRAYLYEHVHIYLTSYQMQNWHRHQNSGTSCPTETKVGYLQKIAPAGHKYKPFRKVNIVPTQ